LREETDKSRLPRNVRRIVALLREELQESLPVETGANAVKLVERLVSPEMRIASSIFQRQCRLNCKKWHNIL
jgi:hypothetical protein